MCFFFVYFVIYICNFVFFVKKCNLKYLSPIIQWRIFVIYVYTLIYLTFTVIISN